MKSITNFRDFSNCLTGTNCRIRGGMLYRSGHLNQVRESCTDFIALGLKTVVDLRLDEEKRRRRLKESIKVVNLPMNFDRVMREKIEPLLRKRGATREIEEIFISKFSIMPAENMEMVKALFKVLSRRESYPLLIHCRAGKDRTGFVSALLQLTLGLKEEQVIEDYLLSNRFYLPQALKKLKLIKLLSCGLYKTDNIEFVLTTRKRYIEATMRTINEGYGGVEGYLKSCGVPRADLEQFRYIMLK